MSARGRIRRGLAAPVLAALSLHGGCSSHPVVKREPVVEFGSSPTARASGEEPDASPAAASAPAQESTSTAEPVAPAKPECVAASRLAVELLDPPWLTAPVPRIDGAQLLAPFFERLGRTLEGTTSRPARVGVYGDSNLTRDWLTGELRRVLQGQLGDAGHGFVAPAKPWTWYQHEDVQHDVVAAGWRGFAPSNRRTRDGIYGLGGIASESVFRGATVRLATVGDSAAVGGKVSRVGVFYLERPEGGRFRIDVDDATGVEIVTDSVHVAVRSKEIAIPDGPHEIRIVATTSRPVRLLGAYLERDVPSVIVDSMGIGGVSYFDLARTDPHSVKEMLRQRNLDLLVLWLGANLHGAATNPSSLGTIVARARDAVPDLPVLVLAPSDQVVRPTDRTSDPQLARVVRELRRAASEHACAFWDLREAMGGEGSMSKFMAHGYAAPDRVHLTRAGSRVMARRLLLALWRAFAEHSPALASEACSRP